MHEIRRAIIGQDISAHRINTQLYGSSAVEVCCSAPQQRLDRGEALQHIVVQHEGNSDAR
jgi:hypothetical protein